MKKIIAFLLLAFIAAFGRDEILLDSANAYKIVMGANPQLAGDLASRSAAIVIFPTFIKAGFILGGSGGKGVMAERSGEGWAIRGVKIGGANFGLQIGYESSYLVIYVLNQSIVNDIKDAKFTVGANASVSALDKGVNARATSDFSFTGDLQAFSNNSGFFVGAKIDGAVIVGDESKFREGSYAYKELAKALDAWNAPAGDSNLNVGSEANHSNLNKDAFDNSKIDDGNSNLNVDDGNNDSAGGWVNPADTGVSETK